MINKGFEADWGDEGSHKVKVFPVGGDPYITEKGEFHTPPGWLSYYKHEPGEWDQPEVGDIRAEYVPYRVHSGEKAAKLFTFHRKHDAGLMQVVDVEKGSKLRFTAWAHAWSNHELLGHESCYNDPHCSAGVGREEVLLLEEDVPPLNGDSWNDAKGNFAFVVGIDPHGGTNPYSPDVVWGKKAYIYNGYFKVPYAEAVAQSDKVTVFLRSKTLWAFKHNDAYWDDAELEVVSTQQPDECVCPRVPYYRKYVLLPQIEDRLEAADWRQGAAIGGAWDLSTFGHSADDSGVGPQERVVVAVNPELWNGSIRDFLDTYYAGASYVPLSAISPVELGIKLLPPLEEDIAQGQAWTEWKDRYFGEDLSQTIGRYGCFLTGFSIILRKIYGRNVTPPALDKLLVMARTAYASGNLLMWENAVGLFSAFDDVIKDTKRYTAAELKGLLNDGYEIILRQVDGAHFVYLESVDGETLKVIDTYDGQRKDRPVSGYAGIRAAHKVDYTGPIEDFNYRVVKKGSKLGTHLIYANHALDFSNRLTSSGAKFPVMKAVDDFGWVVQASINSPDTIFIGRRTWGGEGCGGVESWGHDEMVSHANKALDIIERKIAETPGLGNVIDYWEPYNEPDPPEASGYRALAQLMLVTMAAAKERGLKLGLFSLNAGTPEWEEMDAMAQTGVFERAKIDGHILALHEGTFTTHDPKQYWGDTIPNSPVVEGAGSLNFRYRYLYDLMKERDAIIPLVVSEWYCGDEQSASTETIIDAVAWYDSEMAKDYYAWGFCPFTLGPSPGWTHTDYERFYEGGLIDRIVALKNRENALPDSSYEPPVTPPSPLAIGLHDEGGGQWLMDNGVNGHCLAHKQIQTTPQALNFDKLANNGIKVWLRINWGYADGTGSIPQPIDADGWVNAVVETINRSSGVSGFIIGNEVNNPAEWPGGYPQPVVIITPSYYTDLYNKICGRVSKPIAPFSIDPYNVVAQEFGQPGDPKIWAQYIYDNASRIDFLALHAKTQTNNPDECWSNAKFSNAPLTGRHLHLRTIEDQLSWAQNLNVPVLITELNPQLRGDGTMGWEADNVKWIENAMSYISTQPIQAVMLYRYDLAGGGQEGFALSNKPLLLNAIKSY